MDTKRLNPQPQTPTPSSSGRRRTTIRSDECTNSPEFEFWMVRNPSCPQPNILSADELFVDGVLLPLHLLSTQPKPKPNTQTTTSQPPPPDPDPGPGLDPSPSITDSSAATITATPLSASKRWKDIFRKSEKKNTENNNGKDNAEENEKDRDKEKAKKKERKGGGGATASSGAELNINIWPFSRSRSAGSRPKLFPGASVTRKANSAPCSRSNSAGESKSRKWPSSPGRGGVHLGRSSPVWQVRRGGGSNKNTEAVSVNHEKWSRREAGVSRRSKASSSGSGKARVLNLNVPTCIGYRTHLSCRSDVNSTIGSNIRGSRCNSNSNSNGNSDSNAGDASSLVGGKLFNLRSLFTKKSLLTSH